jgi:hypothetical protein
MEYFVVLVTSYFRHLILPAPRGCAGGREPKLLLEAFSPRPRHFLSLFLPLSLP